MVLAVSEQIELDFEVRGEGTPIVLIPGLNDDRNAWTEVAPGFPDYRCLLIDNRDVGASPRAVAPYTTAEMALDALRAMDRAGVERAHIVGHSMGGTIAQEVAIIAPERVRSLVLIGTFAKPDGYLEHVFRRWTVWIRTLDTAEFLRNTLPYWLGSGTINDLGVEALIDLVAPEVEAQGPDAFVRQCEAILAHDTADRLARIAAPALIVAGDGDTLVRKNHERELLDGIRDSHFAVVEGSGHSPTIEQPAALNSAIRGFLNSI